MTPETMKTLNIVFDNCPVKFRVSKYFFGVALYAITGFPPFGVFEGSCQNIGINTTGASPDASAGIDVNFTDKGILIPRVSLAGTSDVTAIPSPATSLLVYNTNAAMTGGGVGYWYWDGTKWTRFYTGNANNLLCATTNYLPKVSGSSLLCSQVYDDGTNVGIGTVIPGDKLEVNGHLKVNNGATDGARIIWRGGSGGTQEYRARVLTDGHLGFFPVETGNPGYVGEVLSLYQNGFVEVNNTGYPGNLKEYGNIEINHSYDNASSRANHLYLTDQTNANLRGYLGINRNSGAGSDKEYLSLEGVEEGVHWMNIALAADGGNVGVGTTDPTEKFQINSSNNSVFMKMDRGTGNPFLIYFGDNQGGVSNATGVVYFEIGGDETFVMGGHLVPDGSGSRDLGNGSHLWNGVYANDYYMACYGWLSGWFCSDERYKKDILPMKNVLPGILKLQGVQYRWRKDEFPEKHFDDTRQIGLLAQDVEKIYPELVKTGKDGYKSIDYGKFSAVLLEAVKEQQQIIEEMGKRLDAMERTLSSK